MTTTGQDPSAESSPPSTVSTGQQPNSATSIRSSQPLRVGTVGETSQFDPIPRADDPMHAVQPPPPLTGFIDPSLLSQSTPAYGDSSSALFPSLGHPGFSDPSLFPGTLPHLNGSGSMQPLLPNQTSIHDPMLLPIPVTHAGDRTSNQFPQTPFMDTIFSSPTYANANRTEPTVIEGTRFFLHEPSPLTYNPSANVYSTGLDELAHLVDIDYHQRIRRGLCLVSSPDLEPF